MMKYLTLMTILVLSTMFYACQNSTDQTDSTEQATESAPTPTAETETAENPANQSCIERIIALDDKLSAIRNQGTKEQSISKTIKEYLAAMEQVDYSGCPPTLEPAIQQHLDVWKNIIPVTDKYDDRRGEMAPLFKELENSADGARVKAFVQRSYDTWMKVSQIVSENK